MSKKKVESFIKMGDGKVSVVSSRVANFCKLFGLEENIFMPTNGVFVSFARLKKRHPIGNGSIDDEGAKTLPSVVVQITNLNAAYVLREAVDHAIKLLEKKDD